MEEKGSLEAGRGGEGARFAAKPALQGFEASVCPGRREFGQAFEGHGFGPAIEGEGHRNDSVDGDLNHRRAANASRAGTQESGLGAEPGGPGGSLGSGPPCSDKGSGGFKTPARFGHGPEASVAEDEATGCPFELAGKGEAEGSTTFSGPFAEGGEREAGGDGRERLAVRAPAELLEREGVERLARAGRFGEEGSAGGLDAQAAPGKAFEGGGRAFAPCSGDGTGRSERGRKDGMDGKREDEHGYRTAGSVERRGGAGIVLGDDVEADTGVGGIGVVSMGAPAGSGEVKFDIPAKEVATGIEDGAPKIGTGSAAGDAREDDAKRTAIGEAKRARVRGGPCCREIDLTARGVRRRAGGHQPVPPAS